MWHDRFFFPPWWWDQNQCSARSETLQYESVDPLEDVVSTLYTHKDIMRRTQDLLGVWIRGVEKDTDRLWPVEPDKVRSRKYCLLFAFSYFSSSWNIFGEFATGSNADISLTKKKEKKLLRTAAFKAQAWQAECWQMGERGGGGDADWELAVLREPAVQQVKAVLFLQLDGFSKKLGWM